MKIISLIPARSGSKQVPNKNIKLLSGFPLISYSIAASKLCSLINETYLTSDSDEYLEIGKKFDAIPIKRPENISQDTSTDLEYLIHAATELKLSQDDLIILLRPTTPIRNPKIMENAIKYFKLYIGSKDSLKSLNELNESPEKFVKIVKNSLKPYISGKDLKSTNVRRQDSEKAYHPNGYIDVIKVSQLSRGDQYGNNQFPFVTDYTQEIDSIDDFEFCEWKLSKEENILVNWLKGV